MNVLYHWSQACIFNNVIKFCKPSRDFGLVFFGKEIKPTKRMKFYKYWYKSLKQINNENKQNTQDA